MIPITWNVNDKSTHLNVDLNGYGVNYTAITDNDIDNDQLKEKWIKALEQCDSEDKDMIE
ncbi:24267_t:CDS:2, partial [Gigaspora rosea]